MTFFMRTKRNYVDLTINYQVPDDAPSVENIEILEVIPDPDQDIFDLLQEGDLSSWMQESVQSDFIENQNGGYFYDD